jgi:transcriptional regulator with XRE-family HTH domain
MGDENKDVQINYGVKIKQIRQIWRLSQQGLADKIGMSLPNISRYETGKYQPDINFVKDLIFKLHVNPLWFFMDQGDAIVDTEFQLQDEFEDLLEKFRDNYALQQLFSQAMTLNRKDEEYFYKWQGLLYGMKEILGGMKTERQSVVDKQRKEEAEKAKEKK